MVIRDKMDKSKLGVINQYWFVSILGVKLLISSPGLWFIDPGVALNYIKLLCRPGSMIDLLFWLTTILRLAALKLEHHVLEMGSSGEIKASVLIGLVLWTHCRKPRNWAWVQMTWGTIFFYLYRMTCPIGGVTHICPIPISMFNYKMVYIHTHRQIYLYIYIWYVYIYIWYVYVYGMYIYIYDMYIYIDMISIIFPCISCIVPFHSSILMIENDGFSCRFAKHNPLITRMKRMRDRNPTSRSRRYTPVVYQWPSSTQTRLGNLP